MNLYFRDGREFTGTPQLTESGKPFTVAFKNCSRCGGAGGSDKWKHTGWTCFECGGSRGHNVDVKLYTAEKIAKMNAANEKKQAARAAVNAELAAARERERDARREQFQADNKQYFDSVLAVCGADSFASQIIATATRLAQLSDNQKASLDKMVAEIQRKAATGHVGTIGERRDFVCTLVTFRVFQGKFGNSYLHVMRDETGNTIKYIGSKVLGGVRWEGDYSDRYPVVDSNEVIRFKATTDGHEEYKGEKQTIVSRPKVAE